ncbi:endoplasmic reticulum-based factor for assembly of V-ATPase-domain-containing protein [Massariosphaeria phaeospora]|uniref:Endoplasmic reticulum-based factor for assembly of V-ATPase-domain-containing protein n=1 Tax=Massariosphaeria phaeospora TaxID=100035 RepID=A0A7C8MGS9_9PLEO|nr:endoplasmic reticulum-based factor for assembly of V-ATPase-domain-containing protein [Massariosphaeria phaeospora]
MTPAAARAIAEAARIAEPELLKLQLASEPSLDAPKPGNPISHGQLIDVSRLLKKHANKLESHDGDASVDYRLDTLLKGSQVYNPPPPQKKEPTAGYKALMARLRAEEEAREYDRMTNPRPAAETFSQRFPSSSFDQPISIGADYTVEEDDVTYAEVHRQIILIINVLVSIIACSVFFWVAARHWSVPKRLGLSMGGSGIVAIAEVVVYSGYVRRIREAKAMERKRPEVKEVIESWIINGGYKQEKKQESLSSISKDKTDDGIRYRKGKHR